MTEPQAREMLEEGLANSEALIARMREDNSLIDSATSLAQTLVDTFEKGNKLLLFGNGGSAADSIHLAAEFVGRFLTDRRPLPALSLAANLSAITAIGNDYGYEEIFSRQVEALGQSGDVAIGLSTSGRSLNVIAGLDKARSLDLTAVAMTGEDPGPVGRASDLLIAIPHSQTPEIQMGHMLIGHYACHRVEDHLLRS